jgi:hypothetical protein
MSEDYRELSDEIFRFLEKHAKSSASFDPEYDDPSERYNSPDGCELHSAAMMLRDGKGFHRHPWSDWGSGGYGDYSDDEARAWHDDLVRRIALTVGSGPSP